ncbi:hypothetical protein [Ferroacidibacillus organovorans]|uniref:Copper amine oxidase-like N-terminal domain-containing protein n=1 Tax=Ferroacidibacillus organovorans TaxID=1765683 RepID=A0A853K8X9_9BACL|nr:hypothetical protein [Ferroacidibacillus organovorans]KYP79530.1 hypothetical protein AYJ22_14470 [Ferroacidibacillus organovorans]OAG91086.1 hypothetical protein AYW79_13935 [Ferroacidibacillus organovorans]
MRKNAIPWFVAATLLGSLSANPVLAATVSSASKAYPTRIEWNGKVLMSPQHMVRRDSGATQPTSWLPIWYLFQVLKPLGIESSWNGKDWNLTVPSGEVQGGTSLKNSSPPSGDIRIELNGRPVEYAPCIVHRDFSGQVMTSYVPIWYLMQALDRIGIQSTWDGTTWSLTTSKAVPATKMQVVKDFAKTLHIALDSSGVNPFDDVPSADWPYVHTALTKGYFMPDSPTHFGASDNISLETVDHAYQTYVGIPDGDLSWNAGGNTVAWANAVQLNLGVTQGTMTSTEETQVMSNLADLYQGYSKTSDGSYHVWFQPYDAKVAFAHNPNVTAGVASAGQENSIRLADQITFSVQPQDGLTFILPGLADTDAMEITAGSLFNKSGNHTEFSMDGGGTWSVADGFDGYDSRDPSNGGVKSPVKEVMVRTEGHAELGVSEITTNRDTTFVQVDFSPSSGSQVPNIQDSSGQPVWNG